MLLDQWPSYLVRFLVIGIIWVNHHGMFTMIARVDRALLFLNLMMLLLVVATIPFPTALLAELLTTGEADSHVAAAVYNCTPLLMSVTFMPLWYHVRRVDGLQQSADHRLGRSPVRASMPSSAAASVGRSATHSPIAV